MHQRYPGLSACVNLRKDSSGQCTLTGRRSQTALNQQSKYSETVEMPELSIRLTSQGNLLHVEALPLVHAVKHSYSFTWINTSCLIYRSYYTLQESDWNLYTFGTRGGNFRFPTMAKWLLMHLSLIDLITPVYRGPAHFWVQPAGFKTYILHKSRKHIC